MKSSQGLSELLEMKSPTDTNSNRVPVISYINIFGFVLYLFVSTIRYIQLGFKQDLLFLYFYSSSMLMAVICLYKLELLGFSANEKGLKTVYMVASLAFFVMMFFDTILKRDGSELIFLSGFSGVSVVFFACGSCWHLIFHDV